MVTTPLPGWFGEAFRRACVFLRASAGVEGEKIVLVEIVMSMKYNFVFFPGDVPTLGVPFLFPQNPLHSPKVRSHDHHHHHLVHHDHHQ